MNKILKIVGFVLLATTAEAITVYDYSSTSFVSYSTTTGGGMTPGSTNYIQNSSTLQSGATFYVSSGTVAGQLTAGTANIGSALDFGAFAKLNVSNTSQSGYTIQNQVPNQGHGIYEVNSSSVGYWYPFELWAAAPGMGATTVYSQFCLQGGGPPNGCSVNSGAGDTVFRTVKDKSFAPGSAGTFHFNGPPSGTPDEMLSIGPTAVTSYVPVIASTLTVTSSMTVQNIMINGTETVSTFTVTGVAFSTLGNSASNGTILYCSDCTTTIPATCTANLLSSCVCAGSGSGAFAKRLNATWYCN
jgi:hypothetical protein